MLLTVTKCLGIMLREMWSLSGFEAYPAVCKHDLASTLSIC